MKRYFIYYNNNYFESTENINITLMHMIETGVIRMIVDSKESKAWIKNEDGIAKEIKIPEVSGF